MKKITSFIFLISISFTFLGQELVGFKLSDCNNNSYPEYIRNRIVSKKLVNDTLRLSIGFSENCCFSPQPIVNLKNDTLYIEINNLSNMLCGCDCCFELEMSITNIQDTSVFVVYKKNETVLKDKEFQDSMTYQELIFSNNKFVFPTMTEIKSHTPNNITNENGIKIGFWRIWKDNVITADVYFSEKVVDHVQIEWSMNYYPNGQIEICSYNVNQKKAVCIFKEEYDKLMAK
jgi:hypothetical protein